LQRKQKRKTTALCNAADAMTDLKQGGCKMKQCMDADNLHRRLKKIIGQVQAIDRMGG